MGWPQLIVPRQFPPFASDPRLCIVIGGLQAQPQFPAGPACGFQP